MSIPDFFHRRDLRLGLVLAAAAIVAIATTRETVHVPPHRVVLFGAGALLTAVLFVPERQARRFAIAGAAMAGLAASHVVLRAGMPQVHDPDHVWGLWAFARAVRAGSLLPMWLPDLGAGLPLLRFYGPVSFLMTLPGVLAGWAPVALWKEAFVQAGVLSAVTTLFGARLLGAGWRSSLLAATALAFSPWRLAVFNLRGALGEETAFVTAPLVAAAALSVLREPSRRSACTLAIATAILIPTHLITLYCLVLVLIPAAIVQEFALRGERPADLATLARRIAATAAPAVLAAGLAAAWWLPALKEGSATSLPLQTGIHHRYFIYEEHGLSARDLCARRAWDTSRISLKLSDRAGGKEGRQMPFYCGAVLFGAALTAPFWSRSRRTWGPAAGAAAGALCASAPAAAVMTHIPSIHLIQFPWRFLTAGSILATYAVGMGAAALLDEANGWRRMLPLLALPALLVADAASYTGAAGWVPPYHGVTHWAHVEGKSADEPFDVAFRPVPQDWHASKGLARVARLYLPPDDLTTNLSLFWFPYPEWTTPAIYRGFLAAKRLDDFAEAGVSLYFFEERDQPVAVNGKPYATLERGDVLADAGAFTRKPGHIELRPAVPEGGARLVVREQAFPGWEARIDGRYEPIAATPLGFMALDLPAGSHDVVLEFTTRTPARNAGVFVSLLSLAALFVFERRRKWSRPSAG